MLCTRMEHRFSGQIDIAHVVVVKGSLILDEYAQIRQYLLEPYGFTCNHRCAPVFGLCARNSDGLLLLATPGYGSAVEVDLLSAL